MADEQFLAALQQVTGGGTGVSELIGLAVGLTSAGRRAEAVELYKVWAAVHADDPQRFVALFNASSLQSDLGDLAGARASLEAAIAQNPEFFPAYINIGGVLERLGQVDQGVEQWRQVVTRLPQVNAPAIEHKLTAIKQIGRVLIDNQRQSAAEAWLRQALDIVPDQRDVLEQYVALRLAQCEWPVIAPWDGMDRKVLMQGVSPLSMAAYTDDPLLQLGTAKHYVEETIDSKVEALVRAEPFPPIDLTGRRLRVGYVSSDLRDHAVGYLVAEMLELHDRAAVEVFAYNCGPNATGPHNERIRAAVEHWTDIEGMADEAAAQAILADGIDILVDVNGLTRHARTAVFARRPSPIQVNWLGFPGSMGTPYHHYIVADEWIIPPQHELYFSEKVLRLPCYQSNDRKRKVAEDRPTRAEAGLPEDAFVFCCFNGAQKFTRFTVDRWLEILRRTPGSVLWTLENAADINERLRSYAQAGGVEPERLIFAPKQPNPAHLARYPLADLFLDTAPYGAHTTASDALWMGVPVLTLNGRGFAARVCGSLVRAAGQGDMICETAEAYVDKAVALAGDREAVAALKTRLEASRSTCVLFDMELLTRSMEGLYREMVADQQAGRLPVPDLRNLDTYRELGAALDHEAREMRAAEDYQGLYRGLLEERDRMRKLEPDMRLWR